jgi:hypothetical protein
MNEKIQEAFIDEIQKLGSIKKKITGVAVKAAKGISDVALGPSRVMLEAGGAAQRGTKELMKRLKRLKK